MEHSDTGDTGNTEDTEIQRYRDTGNTRVTKDTGDTEDTEIQRYTDSDSEIHGIQKIQRIQGI